LGKAGDFADNLWNGVVLSEFRKARKKYIGKQMALDCDRWEKLGLKPREAMKRSKQNCSV
jgi:hypothetical protein